MSDTIGLSNDLFTQLHDRIGTSIAPTRPQPYVTVATQDAIRHWCVGIGDYNPLYIDEDYALNSVNKGVTGPPSILYAFDKRVTGGVMGLPGVTGMFAGVKWEFHRSVREGDKVIIASATLHDAIEREGKFAGKQVQVVAKIELTLEDGTPIATSYPYGFRQERGAAVKLGKYNDYKPHVYSSDEVEELWTIVENEWRRGSTPLDLQKVHVGDIVGPIVRGPLTLSDFIVFLMGWGGQYIRSHGDWVQWARRHPGGALVNQLGVPDTIEAVHWDYELAGTVGVPAPYDYGPQRASWAITLITNWMGDSATLSALELSLRKHVLVGDAIRISGAVTGVNSGNGGVESVDIEISMKNQRDETVGIGSAKVEL